MINKFTRTNFLVEVEVEGLLEKDLLDNGFYLFEIKRPFNIFTITRDCIGRPDLCSILAYGNINYWWIIGKYNKIDDWWNDIKIGDIIYLPSTLDIDDWYSNVKSKQLN